jgi:hypothetical protein
MGSEHSGTVTRERSPRHGVDAPSTRGTQGCAPAFEVALNVATVGRLMADADRGTRQRLGTFCSSATGTLPCSVC